jgi:hypothetical protein
MVAQYFGVTAQAVRDWCKRLVLGSRVHHTRHYTDERARLTERGRIRIFERDLEKLLRAMRVKSRPMLGPGFWKGVG